MNMRAAAPPMVPAIAMARGPPKRFQAKVNFRKKNDFPMF